MATITATATNANDVEHRTRPSTDHANARLHNRLGAGLSERCALPGWTYQPNSRITWALSGYMVAYVTGSCRIHEQLKMTGAGVSWALGG